MKQMIKSIAALSSFIMVMCMHTYFALILLVKPAMAEEKSATPAKLEAANAPVPPAPPSSDDVNIKINMKDGISIKGLKGAIEKLKELDKDSNKNKLKLSLGGKDQVSDDDENDEDDEDKIVINKKTIAKAAMSDVLEDVLVPIVLFGGFFAFLAYSVYSKNRTRREYLETIKVLAQSGKPIPPELMNGLNAGGGVTGFQNMANPSSQKGAKFVFWGIGIFTFISLVDKGYVGSAFAAIFLVMGIYHLYSSQFLQKQKEAQASNNNVATTTEIQK